MSFAAFAAINLATLAVIALLIAAVAALCQGRRTFEIGLGFLFIAVCALYFAYYAGKDVFRVLLPAALLCGVAVATGWPALVFWRVRALEKRRAPAHQSVFLRYKKASYAAAVAAWLLLQWGLYLLFAAWGSTSV